MKANELYQKCLQKRQRRRKEVWEISGRVDRVLRRNGYETDGKLDREKIMQAINDGSIWNKRGIGDDTVFQICKWLAGDE